MTNSSHPVVVFLLSGLLFVAGCQSTGAPYDSAAWGLTYELQVLDEPRPNRVHILRVDLSQGKTRLVVALCDDPDGAGPAEAALTNPLKLAQDQSVLAFVNTNPWRAFPDATGKTNRKWYEGQPVDISGLAASGGHLRSPASPGGLSVWTDESGHVSLGSVPSQTSVVEGMAGFSQILKEQLIVAPAEGPKHPRTAIGIDQTGEILWLVVVDGRQKNYSEGVTTHELAGIMRELGCWHAANMDGGGSSVMGRVSRDGQREVVNSPSDKWRSPTHVRPLPMILTICRIP
jgi:hypothetical protein